MNLTHYKMRIFKKNEVYIKITDIELSVAAQLNDFFTFEVPGFKYMPAYRNKTWDGKIRLYNIVTGEIYMGLLPYIEEYLQNNGVGKRASPILMPGTFTEVVKNCTFGN